MLNKDRCTLFGALREQRWKWCLAKKKIGLHERNKNLNTHYSSLWTVFCKNEFHPLILHYCKKSLLRLYENCSIEWNTCRMRNAKPFHKMQRICFTHHLRSAQYTLFANNTDEMTKLVWNTNGVWSVFVVFWKKVYYEFWAALRLMEQSLNETREIFRSSKR